MANKTEVEILRERERAVKRIKKRFDDDDIEIVDSYFGMAGSDHPLASLGKSLIALSTADVAYFVKDFEKYRGCKIEKTWQQLRMALKSLRNMSNHECSNPA